MSTQIDSPAFIPSTNYGKHSVKDNGDILINTLELVDTVQSNYVPNYLVDTKIYARLKRNAIVQAEPHEVHFEGFTLGSVSRQLVTLTNVSSSVETFHIVPPQSKYFVLKYTKPERLVPGFGIQCTIEFHPNELRYFYDHLQIHTRDEENNILIPIHAYPVANLNPIPEFLKFPFVPVGKHKTLSLPLKSNGPVDFDFVVHILQDHPAFKVHPVKGILKSNSKVDVQIEFSPFDFVTAHMTLEIGLSQFNFKPKICYVTGYAEPGMERRLVREAHGDMELFGDAAVLDPRTLSPLNRARENKRSVLKHIHNARASCVPTKSVKSSQVTAISRTESGVIKKDGYRIPKSLNTPSAIAKVLNQQQGKMRTKDLREFLAVAAENDIDATRQMKETLFEEAVRQDVHQERQNQLRWQVRLGDTAMSEKSRARILVERELHWNIYRRRRGDPNVTEELLRTRAGMLSQRTRRGVLDPTACTQLQSVAKFDVLQNDNWAARRAALQRFRQGAWRMIYRIRAERRLKNMREVVVKMKAGEDVEEELAIKSRAAKLYPIMNQCLLDASRVIREPFATAEPALDPSQLAERYHQKRLQEQLLQQAENRKSDELEETGHEVGVTESSGGGTRNAPYYVPPTEMIVRRHYQYQALSVPQQYQINGYQRLDIDDVSRGHVKTGFPRPLRTGAEDEVVNIPLPVEETLLQQDSSHTTPQLSTNKPPQLDFTPPPGLFEPVQYPPLHIFNPSPGLQAFEQPKHYAEVDIDSALCPLPQYYRAPEGAYGARSVGTQRRYLDHTETIAHMMNWRKFPSPSLTALTQTQTVTSVWLPRWNDPFDETILCDEIPLLLNDLPKEDESNILAVSDGVSSENAILMNLTPEMVKEEFPVIATFAQKWSELQGEFVPPKIVEVEPPPQPKQIIVASSTKKAGVKSKMDLYRPKSPPPPPTAIGPVPRWTKEKELDENVTRETNRLGKKAEKSWQILCSTLTNSDVLL